MGICRLTPTSLVRRIDIKTYPFQAFAFAQLYFTGNAYFNRSMRNSVHHLGLTLGDKGMYACMRNDKNVVTEGSKSDSVVCYTERQIFELVGAIYVPPSERGIGE